MIQIILRPPTVSDVAHVAANMRPIDALECELVRGLTPKQGLELSIETGDRDLTLAAEMGGAAQCIFGVSPIEDSLLRVEGAPWMLGTNAMCNHVRELLYGSKPIVARMAERYERLANIVHADNTRSIRLLKWLGFRFGPKLQVSGAPFLLFEMGSV